MDVLLGPGAAAPHKLEVGNPIVTLGVETSIGASGVTFKVSPAKAEEWASQIQSYLQMGMLTSGEASKLAGKCLCFAPPRLDWKAPAIRATGLRFSTHIPPPRQSIACASVQTNQSKELQHWKRIENGSVVVVQCAAKGHESGKLSLPSRGLARSMTAQVRPWRQEEQEPLHLLCDARRPISSLPCLPFPLSIAGPHLRE